MKEIICSLVLLLMSNIVEPGTTPVCHLPTFLPAACGGYEPQTVAGADGANGLNGERGHPGRRGEKGDAASFCHGNKCKVESLLYFGWLVNDVYWMSSTLDLIDGLDIGTMTKEELIKIILNQNRKIVNDHEDIDQLDKALEDLKNKLQSSGGNLGIIDELKKKLAEKIKENKEKDKKITELNDKCTMINNAMEENVQLKKEINNLKNKINDLNKKLAEAGNSVQKLAELHKTVNKLHEELKDRSKVLENEVAKLKKELQNKGLENVYLQIKVKELELKIKVAHEACKGIEKQKDDLMKHCEVLMKTCKSNEAAQHKVIDSLKKQIEDLKNKCENLGKYEHKIMELEKKLKELEKKNSGRNTEEYNPNQIFCAGDTSSWVTTIPNEADKIRVFNKYIPNEHIELPCVEASDRKGPWLVFLNREDGSVNFHRMWEDYKNGFGNPNGEFWLGLEAAHVLTMAHPFKLRVELEDHKGKKFFGSYKKFEIGEGPKYRLRISGYTGELNDALNWHNNMAFSTEDRDQDAANTQHCAQGSGGWWFKDCTYCLLTGKWHIKSQTEDTVGMRWYSNGIHDPSYSWKKARMLIQPVLNSYKGQQFKG